MSLRSMLIALAVCGVCWLPGYVGGLRAQESVGVSGTGRSYPTEIAVPIGGKPVTMTLTGVALRQKYFFNVYTIGSYVRAGVRVRGADELAAADCPKQLHLIMERDITGADMAGAFQAAIRQTHAAPAFNDQLAALQSALLSQQVKAGDEIRLTNVPGVGLMIDLAGQAVMSTEIKDPAFSRAVWEIYLGQNPISTSIRQGLVSRQE